MADKDKSNAEPSKAEPGKVAEATGKLLDAVAGLYPSPESTLGKKFDQGRDELANALFGGSAYLPWPGQGQEPDHGLDDHLKGFTPSKSPEKDRGR